VSINTNYSTEKTMVILEKRNSPAIKVNEMDKAIFTKKFPADCLRRNSCHDICCTYGCQVDAAEIDKILLYKRKLELILGIPAEEWFSDKVDYDGDYPSGQCVRTRVYDGKCVFHNRRDRGCTLHQLAIEEGVDQHELKPMVCSLFPVTWNNGCLFVSEYLEELPCANQGVSVFEAQKDELHFYLCDDFILSRAEKFS
jgi:Fe-S-cluster containining protein